MTEPNSATHDLAARDARTCWHPYTQHGLGEPLLPVVGAEGAWLELADGRRILDAISSWWTCLHGHGHPRLVAALADQAARLDHVLFAGCTHPGAVELAERLLTHTPEGLTRVFYSDDGSTAVEVALKVAYQSWVRRGHPERTVFVALEGAYHGDTFGAMAAGDPDPFFAEFDPLLFEVIRIPPDPTRLEEVLARDGERVAAVLVEPLVQGAAGMCMYPPEVLTAFARICREHGVLLAADEVMTGFGRTGSLFACEIAGVSPDILCLAKGLTGGILPLAATVVSEEIYDAFLSPDRGQAFFHGHSFTASALGCAAALASLDLVEEEGTPERLDRIGRWIEGDLGDLAEADGVLEVRRRGGIVAVELTEAGQEAGYLSGLGPRLRAAAAGGEVLLRPLGNVLYAIPPSCTTREEAGTIAAAIEGCCRQVLGTA